MAFTQNDNSGALFKTEKENDRQPDYSGTIIVSGKSYWISGWIKEAKSNGKKYMSLSVTPKQKPKVEEEDVDQSKPTHRPARS